jgi:hypothetical protein
MKFVGKIFLALVISFFTIKIFTMKPYPWIVLDNVNLGVHEFGHLIFGIFGSKVLMIWGGTIMQLLIPAIFFTYFVSRKDIVGSIFCFWWFGHSLHNISIYIADSTCLCMPLLGGDNSEHDWFYLLSHYGKLKLADKYASVIGLAGKFLMLASLLALYYETIRNLITSKSPNLE